MHETVYFADAYCDVDYFHKTKDYIFGFSIPVTSFWYKECIGAITVLWLKEAPIFGKSALLVLYGTAWKRYFADPYSEVGFLHQIKHYIFRFSIPVASFWYKKCIGANTVPWLKEAPNI